jgi:catechol 2,3-dioxygenase-like lactoylglutathione lyase family enzyme
LDVREEGTGLALYTLGNPRRWGRLLEGPRKRSHHLSFGCFEEDLPRFRALFETDGITLVDAPVGFESNGLWFRDYEGSLIEITIAPKSAPDEKSRVGDLTVAPGCQGAAFRRSAPRVHPTRLSHVLMFTSSASQATEFYGRYLGLKLSDRSMDFIAFLHGVHGSDHHLLAFGGGAGPGIHHVAWDVPTIDEVGIGAAHMATNGYAEGWGFGRHVLGSNYFHYVRDPWGGYSEYSCGIDYVPPGFEWDESNNSPEDSLYLFGPPVPSDFITNYELTNSVKNSGGYG